MMSNRDRTFMWDFFVDECTALGLDPAVEDFDAWLDTQSE
jgi:hypothetical protein